MLYAHLFTGRGCEAPGCAHLSVSLYPTHGGSGLVRACNPLHAHEIEADSLRKKCSKLHSSLGEQAAQEPRYCPDCGELTYGRCRCEYRDYVPGEELPIGDEEGER